MYSFSKINVYRKCPKKYQYRYVDKLVTESITTPALFLGDSVHKALEWLYQRINTFQIPTHEQLQTFFDQLWIQKLKEEKNPVFNDKTTEEDCKRKGSLYLQWYYEKNAPFQGPNIVGTEMTVFFDLAGDEKKKFQAKIDRLDQDKDTFIITDYKTGKHLPTKDDEEYKDQLMLYATAIQQKYGNYLKKIKARLYYLHFSLIDEREVSPELSNPIVEKYSHLIDQIERSAQKYMESLCTDKDAFPVSANEGCSTCEYQKLCPLYRHQSLEDRLVDGGVLGEKSIKVFIDQYVELSQKISLEEKEKESLKEILVEYAKTNDVAQLFGNSASLSMSKKNNYTAKDKEVLKSFLEQKDLFEKAYDIPYHKINKLVESGEMTEEEIQKFLEKKDSRTLKIKKTKGDDE